MWKPSESDIRFCLNWLLFMGVILGAVWTAAGWNGVGIVLGAGVGVWAFVMGWIYGVEWIARWARKRWDLAE